MLIRNYVDSIRQLRYEAKERKRGKERGGCARKVGGVLLLFIALVESKARGDSRTKRISAAFFYASAVKLQNGKEIRLVRNTLLLNFRFFSRKVG